MFTTNSLGNNFTVFFSFPNKFCLILRKKKPVWSSDCVYFPASFLSNDVEALLHLQLVIITNNRNAVQEKKIRVQMKLIQISGEIVLEDANLNICEFVSLSVKSYVYVCVCFHTGQLPAPRLLWVWVFLEPLCHLPSNSNNVVDQQLFTNRQEDGTNLITPYSPVSPSLETASIWAPYTFSIAGRHKLILTAIMNIVFHSSGREPGNNEVLTIICSPNHLTASSLGTLQPGGNHSGIRMKDGAATRLPVQARELDLLA